MSTPTFKFQQDFENYESEDAHHEDNVEEM